MLPTGGEMMIEKIMSKKTTVTSMYQTSEQSSNDNVDLIYQNERREGRGQWGV
jgi:hypothetical protein